MVVDPQSCTGLSRTRGEAQEVYTMGNTKKHVGLACVLGYCECRLTVTVTGALDLPDHDDDENVFLFLFTV